MTLLTGRAGGTPRERCRDLIGSLPLPDPFDLGLFRASLGARVGSRVEIVPVGVPVPAGCVSVWRGFTGTDRVGYNPGWQEEPVTLAAHALGHLLLGHCGEVRDGGQFACLLPRAQLDARERHQVLSVLHDASGGVSRLFSDGEERDAAVFSCVLRELLDGRGQCRAGQDYGFGDLLTCVG